MLTPSRLAAKNPMGGRTFCLLWFVMLSWPSQGWAQDGVMKVEDAVEQALAQPDVKARLDAELLSEKAKMDATTMLPTPTLQLLYGNVPGDLNVGVLEIGATVEQRFDVSGWRDELRASLPHRQAALKAHTKSWRLETTLSVKRAFYEVRHQQERLRIIERWIRHLEVGLASMRAREKSGDTSTYQSKRIAYELESARMKHTMVSASLNKAWGGLQRWLPLTSRPTLAGPLRPTRPPNTGTAQATHPELERLTHLERALQTQAQAWGAPYLRDWSIAAGYRFVQVGPSTGHGVLVSLSVPLGLWNTDTPKLEALSAQQAKLRADRRLRQAFAQRELDASRARLDAALEALEGVSNTSGDPSLAGLAKAAFEAGELSLTELLDVYSSQAERDLERLALEREARDAAIELERYSPRGE